MRENKLASNNATHVDMVVVANPKTDSDLKFRRNSWERPIRAMSQASASLPVAIPVASTRTRSSASNGLLPAGVVEAPNPLVGSCISEVAMACKETRKNMML